MGHALIQKCLEERRLKTQGPTHVVSLIAALGRHACSGKHGAAKASRKSVSATGYAIDTNSACQPDNIADVMMYIYKP